MLGTAVAGSRVKDETVKEHVTERGHSQGSAERDALTVRFVHDLRSLFMSFFLHLFTLCCS